MNEKRQVDIINFLSENKDKVINENGCTLLSEVTD